MRGWMAACLIGQTAWADPDWEEALPWIVALGVDQEAQRELRADRTWVRVDGRRLVGARIVDAPRDVVWATVHDPGVVADPAVDEVRLSADPAGVEVWYGRLRLPPPFLDRQWVVRSAVDAEIARRSGGRVWRRAWVDLPDLAPARAAAAVGKIPGLSEGELREAMPVGCNRGSWTVAALDTRRSLVVATTEVDLGGQLPAWIIRDLGRTQLVRLLDRVAQRVHAPHPQVVAGG